MTTIHCGGPFGLELVHRPEGVRANGSTWALTAAPSCPVIVFAALRVRFNLDVGFDRLGRLVLFSRVDGAPAPNLDACEEVARNAVLESRRLFRGWQPGARVIPFPRRGGVAC